MVLRAKLISAVEEEVADAMVAAALADETFVVTKVRFRAHHIAVAAVAAAAAAAVVVVLAAAAAAAVAVDAIKAVGEEAEEAKPHLHRLMHGKCLSLLFNHSSI
mmetsp:Transcript_645/g.1228  ORF Transcript_645/g.1228 Transcript_645/m.1228 type:complete len:104 (-) Transcript_645:47-358(-)